MVNNKTLIIAAMILGASILGGAVLIQSSLDKSTVQLEELSNAIASLQLPPEQKAQARRQLPDPNKRQVANLKGAPMLGPENAAVTIVEFSDFQCPYCKRVDPTLEQIRQAYGDKVRIVFKHNPLPFHTQAPAAHAAAEAAHRQGKFWEMHDLILNNQRELTPAKFEEYAAKLGLDLEKFNKDRESEEVKKRIEADTNEAQRVGILGTPGFLINGRFFSGAQPFASFKRVIDEELAKSKT